DGGSGVRTVPVSLHHDGTPNRDLSDGRASIFGGLRIDDLAFNALHRSSDRTDHVVIGIIHVHSRRRLCEAIALQHINTEIVEAAGDFRIEARPSGSQVAHLGSEAVVDFAEQDATGIDANLA